MKTYSSKKFTYDATLHIFSAEASDLAGGGEFTDRIYPEACDEGFVMVSAKTGSSAVFCLSRIDRDNDNDIGFWEFKPTFETLERNLGLSGCKAVIFND